MSTTYFNYIISQCRTTNITGLNGIYKSIDHLRESSHIFFNDEYLKVDDEDLINETFLLNIPDKINHSDRTD